MGMFDDLNNEPISGGGGGMFADLQPTKSPTLFDRVGEISRGYDDLKANIGAGLVRGAGSIGATLIRPFESGVENEQRRQSMDAGLQSLVGADPKSFGYGAGKLGSELLGAGGVGSLLGKGVASFFPQLATALSSGGMSTGALLPESAKWLGARGIDALTRAGAGAAVGGASAGLINPNDIGVGAAIGGTFPLLAQGVGAGSRALGSALRGGEISPEVANLYTKAKSYGVDIPADRLANSKPMNALASTLNYVPFSGRAATEQKMNTQLNQALSRTFGQDSPNVTMALRKAEGDLGAKFDSVLKSNTVAVDKQFATEIGDIYQTAQNELGADALKPISSQIQTILDKGASGSIDGQAAYNIKKTLDRLGRGSGNEAFHARELKGSLMGALDRSLGQTEAAAFAETRKQYGNMLGLQNLAKNGAEGEISVARLANMKNINNPEMQDLADIAAQFVRPREGQHGAMQRAVAASAGALSYGSGGMGALPLLGGIGLGRSANSLLNSDLSKRFVLNQSPRANALTDMVRQGGYRALPLAAPFINGQ
jgi:hypothetical protein